MGGGWPGIAERQDKFDEAVRIIRSLLDGDTLTHHGEYFDVDAAKLWDLPDEPPPIGIAVSGEASCELAGELADLVIATEPKSGLIDAFERHGGEGKPRVGQLPICWDPDRAAAVRRAHAQFRWFGGGWKVNSELPTPAAFAGATQFVREEDVAASIPCGDDVGEFVDAIGAYKEAGFTEIAVVQVGGDSQSGFLDWAGSTLLPALRDRL